MNPINRGVRRKQTRTFLGKREKNKTIVRERLLDEALRLFSVQGFEKTTVSDIVQASSIGRGTFYNYFTDVKDIFNAVIDRLNSEIRTVIYEARKEAKTVYESLYFAFKSYFDYVSDAKRIDFHRKNQAYIRSTSYGSDSVKQIIADLQKNLKKQKVVDQFEFDEEFQLLSFVLIGTPAELFLNIHDTGLKMSNEQLANFLATLFTKGLEHQVRTFAKTN